MSGASKRENLYMNTGNIIFSRYSMCFDYQCSCNSIYLFFSCDNQLNKWCFHSFRLFVRPFVRLFNLLFKISKGHWVQSSAKEIQARPLLDQSPAWYIYAWLLSGQFPVHDIQTNFHFPLIMKCSTCSKCSGVFSAFMVFRLYVSLCS